MPVTDFECQIARGQIGRYLDGGALSPQALASLEEHLSECAGCKAAVADRRAALLGTLSGASHAVVSMPVENPLVAALRARANEDGAMAKIEPAAKPVVAKAAPRYAKGAKGAKDAGEPKAAPATKSMTKPLALAALLAVVLVGMGRLTHTVNAPTAKASTAFAAESLPESVPASPKVDKTLSNTVGAAMVIPAKTAPKPVAVTPTVPKPVVSTPKSNTAAALKPKVVPAKKNDSWGDLFQQSAKTTPKLTVKSPVGKPRVGKAKPALVKRVVRPASSGPLAARPHRITRLRPVVTARRTKLVRRANVARRLKATHHAPRTTVRIYGTDGRLLK